MCCLAVGFDCIRGTKADLTNWPGPRRGHFIVCLFGEGGLIRSPALSSKFEVRKRLDCGVKKGWLMRQNRRFSFVPCDRGHLLFQLDPLLLVWDTFHNFQVRAAFCQSNARARLLSRACLAKRLFKALKPCLSRWLVVIAGLQWSFIGAQHFGCLGLLFVIKSWLHVGVLILSETSSSISVRSRREFILTEVFSK